MIFIRDFEEYAKNHLDDVVWAFFSQGAEREVTLKENLRSYTRYRLVPRLLRNVSSRDLSVTVLGEKLPLPIGLSPTACQKFAHPDGEAGAAAAAAEMGTIYTLSTMASTSLEDVARINAEKSPLWMQVSILKERKYTEKMVRKAVAFGYKALVLTVDCPVKGLRHKTMKNPLKLPPYITFPNMAEVCEKAPKGNGYMSSGMDHFCDTLTWDDVAWIKSLSSLPVVLKGIITAEDAVQAASIGASAVWVSNHGGRQLDGIDATLDALPSISEALAGSGCEIYMDGGIRWGSDVLKALALGAKAVFIGRPYVWGLAHSGKAGVRKVLEILQSELDRAMHLSGCHDISDIGPHLIKKVPCSQL